MALKDELSSQQYSRLQSMSKDQQRQFLEKYVASKNNASEKSFGRKTVDFGKGFASGLGKVAVGMPQAAGSLFSEGAARTYEGTGIIGGKLGFNRFESGARSLAQDMRSTKTDFNRQSGLNRAENFLNQTIESGGKSAQLGSVGGELAAFLAPYSVIGKLGKAEQAGTFAQRAGTFLKTRAIPEVAADIGVAASLDETDDQKRNTLVNVGVTSLASLIAGTPLVGRFKPAGSVLKGADEVAEEVAKISSRDKNAIQKLYGNMNKLTDTASDAFASFGDEVGMKLKDLGFSTKIDEFKINNRFQKMVDDLEKNYSRKTLQLAEDYIDAISDGVKVARPADDVISAAAELRRINDAAFSLQEKIGYRKLDGTPVQKLENFIPKDFKIPDQADKFEDFLQKTLQENIEKGRGIQDENELRSALTSIREYEGGLSGPLGSFQHSRETAAPIQTRDIVSRQRDYLEKVSREVAKVKNLGNQNAPGKHEVFENFIVQNINPAQQEYARDAMRALLGETGSRLQKRTTEELKRTGGDKLASGFLLSQEAGKLSNTLSSFIMGFSATLFDLFGNPIRSAAYNLTDARAMAQVFTREFAGKAKEVEDAAKRIGMFDSRKNLRRDGDIELFPDLVDFYFKAIGQKWSVEQSAKTNIKMATAKLQGLSKSKKLSKSDISELKDEFGFSDEMIKNRGDLDMEDFIGAVLFNTEQRILGRGAAELVTASQHGAWMKNMYKFIRFPLTVASETRRSFKRDPLKTSAIGVGAAYGAGAALEGIRDIDKPGSDALADILSISEQDEGRNKLMKLGKLLDKEMGTEDAMVFERVMRGINALTGMDLILNKVLGDEFASPSEKIFTGLNINVGQATSAARGIGQAVEAGEITDDARKNLARPIGLIRDMNKFFEDFRSRGLMD